MASKATDPIGIFDSGIGGLTVAHAVKELLPLEQLIYFGDTAHLPYGDKSTAAIQAYSIKICDVLLQQNCKLILIACNSASAAANDLVREYVGQRTKIMNVIDPVVDYVREQHAGNRIGLIGTKQTVGSQVYKDKIEKLDRDIEFKALPTPLLVPMIEEGFFKGQISESIIAKYLNDPELQDLKALILGCTHYPLIKDSVQQFYKGLVDVIDSSEIVAKSLKAFLEFNNLISQTSGLPDKFMISDYTDSFEHSTKLFFQEEVHLELYKLWE